MIWRGILSKINLFTKIQNGCPIRCFSNAEIHVLNYRRFSAGGGGFRWKQNHSNSYKNVLHAATIWATIKQIVGLSKPLLDDDEIKHHIKLAIGAAIEKNYDEAIEILHTALKLAQNKKNESAENYIFDMLANLYYQKGELDPAERLFTTVMGRLIVKGTPQNDPAVIEISLKLSDIYGMKGDHEKAELGFQFCVASAREHVIKADENFENAWTLKTTTKTLQHDLALGKESATDPYALYGIVLETYAQYLVSRGKAAQSVDYINRALELSHEIYGASSSHSIVMLNNYATICLRKNAFELARKYMSEVMDRVDHCPEFSEQLPGFYCNYAEALWHCDQTEKALVYARKGVDLAKQRNNAELLNHCQDFLRQLEKDSKKAKKKN